MVRESGKIYFCKVFCHFQELGSIPVCDMDAACLCLHIHVIPTGRGMDRLHMFASPRVTLVLIVEGVRGSHLLLTTLRISMLGSSVNPMP